MSAKCDAMTEVGSYPGDWTAWCGKEKGHTGPHGAEYTWEDDDAWDPSWTENVGTEGKP
jgi:hypothetical protein